MTKLVFIIDKEKAVRITFEHLLKKNNIDVYTVDLIKDNFYLLDDLKPALIIFDRDTCHGYIEELLTYQGKAKLVMMNFKDSLSDSFDNILILPKPLEVEKLVENIKNFLT